MCVRERERCSENIYRCNQYFIVGRKSLIVSVRCYMGCLMTQTQKKTLCLCSFKQIYLGLSQGMVKLCSYFIFIHAFFFFLSHFCTPSIYCLFMGQYALMSSFWDTFVYSFLISLICILCSCMYKCIYLGFFPSFVLNVCILWIY